MKKYLKVMLVLVVALSLFCTFALANTFDVTKGNKTGINTSVDDFFDKFGVTVIDIVQTAGIIIAVVMIMVVGIQWLMGTPAKKQELKGRLVNVAIGAFLIVCGVGVLGFIEKVGNEVIKDSSVTGTVQQNPGSDKPSTEITE